MQGVFIPGSNNGTSGYGLARGAMFPSTLNGPWGQRGSPLPIDLQMPTGVVDKPYYGHAFGRPVIYELTPGGSTTEEGWGFKTRYFGKSLKYGKTSRCKGKTLKNSRCKHRTSGKKYCKHHSKRNRKSRK